MGKDQDLLEACRTGNLPATEKLLSARLHASRSKGSKAAGGGALSTISKSLWSLKSANVNCVDASGDTPLHLAALNGHKEIVSRLLECEASPTILDSQDCSPLHLAAWNGHAEICDQLLQSPDGQALLNLQTRDGNTALHFSAQHGHDSTLILLLQKKADPTIRNLEDLSPLDLAAQYDRLEIVKQLVRSHPELVAPWSSQNTPLHLASRNGHRAVVQNLLDSGFPINAKTDKGTALHEAANFCKLDVIKLLLERGIDISVKSQTGCSAEDILRSIPSKAAEDALNILKTHIYHQRTPDSDGEKGIVDESEIPQVTQSAIKVQPPSVVAPAPPVMAPTPAERKRHLHNSLPQNSDVLSAPPPIPPRQSVRVPDRSEGLHEPGLVPLKLPSSSSSSTSAERSVERDHHSDEDRHRHNTSPRDLSPSARSPSDQPKKPPRKKPLSFRKPDSGLSTLPAESAPGGGNYVNLDPKAEKALLDSKIAAESESKSKGATASETKDVPADSAGVNKAQVTENNNENQKQEQQPESHLTSDHVIVQGSNQEGGDEKPAEVTAPVQQACDIEEKKDETVTKPPSSLDINQSTAQKPEPASRSPSHPRQPPTPDCPPPSPGTAIQNIHSKIQPLEKRRSRDMETITDSTITGQDDPTPPLLPTVVPAVGNAAMTCNPQKGTPTPQTVEASAAKPVTPGQTKKPKPTPLPRKSSLSSDTRDLPLSPTSAAREGEGGTRGLSSEEASRMEGYEGGKPAGHGKVLRKQEQIKSEYAGSDEGDGRSDLPKSRSSSVGSSSAMPGGDESNTVEVMGETVQMRRSVSAGNEPMDWEGHIFAGLLRGSVAGTARDVVHQLGATNATAAALRKKRKSTLSTFAPVMEEDKDIDPDKVLCEIDNICLSQNPEGRKSDDNVFDDDSEDWAQISATFETFGVGLSRESVFIREHEENFAKFLSEGKDPGESKIQSVGEWLADIGLPQYENTLVANGFDDTDFLGGTILEDQDLKAIGVENAEHRNTILEAATKLAKLQPIDPNHLPETVAEWLGSLRLDYYFNTFMSHKYDSMDRVIKLWELELDTVLDITSIGHRKRILASLGERKPETTSPGRSRIPSLEGLSNRKSPFDNVDLYRDYTGVRSRASDSGSNPELRQGQMLDFSNNESTSPTKGRGIRDSAIHIRAPHLMYYTGAIKQWRHKPETLIKGCCNYTAHYLGSTLVKELKGAMSTQEGIAKLKKSSEVINKIPTIMLSISYKGVKFIDAHSKKVVCDHEIANIFCACQDGEHMNFFAYITKDREVGKLYCHVFSVRSRELAGEIILTLGEAFEIAYQMALKERAEQAAEEFDKISTSDGDDTTSVSSKASVNTV